MLAVIARPRSGRQTGTSPPSASRHLPTSRANWRETCSGLRCWPSMSPNTSASSRASCSARAPRSRLRHQHGRPARVEVDDPRPAGLRVALDDPGALARVPDHAWQQLGSFGTANRRWGKREAAPGAATAGPRQPLPGRRGSEGLLTSPSSPCRRSVTCRERR